MAGAEAPRPVRTYRYFGIPGHASQGGLASTSLLGSCPSGRRSSNEAAGVSQRAVFVCDRFRYALKHVAVLYEFSTLIEPEDVSASPQPVDPATPESARKPVGFRSVPCRWRNVIFRWP